MTNTTTYSLTDGGYVVFQAAGSGELAQKYDSHGAAVGSAVQVYDAPDSVTPLSDGGYVVVKQGSGFADLRVISTANAQLHYMQQDGVPVIAASPEGGFLVEVGGTSTPARELRLYDNTGSQIAVGLYENGPAPTVSLDSHGDYVLTRTGFQPLVIDPTEGASAFHGPAALPGGIVGIDDSGSSQQTFSSGAAIGDTTPTFQVPVTATGDLELSGSGPVSSPVFVHVTAADVAAGYVDVTTTISAGLNTLFFTPFGDSGLAGPATSFGVRLVGTLSISAPAVHSEGGAGDLTDFAFTVTRSNVNFGAVDVDFFRAYGGGADDSDFAGPTAGTIHFASGQTTQTIHISVAGDTLAEPDETFTIALANARGAVINSHAGSATTTILNDDQSVPMGQTTFTATGSSPQTITGNDQGDTFWSNNNGNTLIGGTGDDTFHLGRNGDLATGGGGHDTFTFEDNPWSPSGRITDFGADDVLDLTTILHKAGYVSGDAVAEGFVKFASGASGNAQVWFNPEPAGSGAFWLVTGLDGVDSATLHANAGLITT